jgi:hypothetical protein
MMPREPKCLNHHFFHSTVTVLLASYTKCSNEICYTLIVIVMEIEIFFVEKEIDNMWEIYIVVNPWICYKHFSPYIFLFASFPVLAELVFDNIWDGGIQVSWLASPWCTIYNDPSLMLHQHGCSIIKSSLANAWTYVIYVSKIYYIIDKLRHA